MPRPHTGRAEHMVGSEPGCPGCQDYYAARQRRARWRERIARLWRQFGTTVTWEDAPPIEANARVYQLHPKPDDALSIVTDAALEFASVLDHRRREEELTTEEHDHLATLALEIRDAVAELDAIT